MAELMKAAVAHTFGAPLTIQQVPIPAVKPGCILVELFACGVCHTDLHAINGDWPVKPTLPFIPGHEGTGIVTALGAGVTSIKLGTRVGIPWLHSACGLCEYCLAGWETLCKFQSNTGYSVNGCYAQYVLADPQFVVPLPAELDFYAAAPILCAGLTVYKGIKQTNTKPGDWLIVSGIGGLGHLAIQYAKAMGRNVIAIDIYPEKLALAKALHADLTINAQEEDPNKLIHEQIGGAHGILATAVSATSFTQAVKMLRRGGTLVLVGLPPGDFKLSIFEMVLDAKTVRGSIVGTRLDLKECLQFAAEGKVTAQFSTDKLDNINTVFANMQRGAISGRIVLALK